jgi:hypothetical protein
MTNSGDFSVRNPWWHAVATGGYPTAWAQLDPALRPAAESGITYFPDVVADLRPPMPCVIASRHSIDSFFANKSPRSGRSAVVT